jgi:hypothetical protein
MHDRAKIHPERCQFCDSAEFWSLGVALWSGIDVKTNERANGATITVRCQKCQATFNAEMERDPAKLKWHLGRV